MIMAPGLRKLALTAHVTCAVGLLGAIAGFFALGVAGLASRDPALLRSVYPAMELTARSVIVPLAVAALVTGLVQALGTPWGLARHYWVLAKLLLTLLATLVLLLQLEPIGYLADAVSETSFATDDLLPLRLSLVWPHAGGGLLVLLATVALSVYKPRGWTRYGWRKRHEQRQPS
jgi:hypothetical protein